MPSLFDGNSACERRLQTARAARWRDDFNAFYGQPTPAHAEAYLRRWCYGAKRSRLEPVKDFVQMVESHWDGIIAWQHSQISNGLLEGHQFFDPSGQAQSPRLPVQDQDDHCHLSHRGQAPATPNPHDLARSPFSQTRSR
ncbi:MAG: transposase [Dermatophilaceae bacterium]